MVDVLIKDVPLKAVDEVKRMALVAVERFLSQKTLVVESAKQKEFEDTMDATLLANGLEAKFTKIKAEPIQEEPK